MKAGSGSIPVKSIAFVCVSVLALLSCVGCGAPKADVSSRMKKGSYKEWYEYLEPALDNVKITEYEEKDGSVSVEIENTSTEVNGYAQIASLHNEFIDANPDYFSNGEEFIFSNFSGGRITTRLTSSIDEEMAGLSLWYKGDIQKVKIDEDGKLIYAFMNKLDRDDLIKNSDPVLIKVLFLNGYSLNPPGWDYISDFPSLKKIVLEENERKASHEDLLDSLQNDHPELEVILY